MRLGNLLKRTLVPAALCALALAACGSQPKAVTATTTAAKPPTHGSDTVAIYSSLPLRGSERAVALQIQQGIRLALARAHYRVRRLRIRYFPRSDSPLPARHGRVSANWSPTQTVKVAAQAVRNPQTVAYIGDLNSGATELSLPILNQAGIAQITPGSGYPGLTDYYAGIDQPSTEPGKYYPQSPRNLLRMIPSDVVQASAALALLRRGGCQTVAAWDFDGTGEGTILLNAIAKTAPMYGMKYVVPPKLPAGVKTATFVTYVGALKPLDLHCAVLVGRPTRVAEMLTLELRLQLGTSLPIVGASGFCTSTWARGIRRAYAKTVVPGLYCMTPYLPLSNYSTGSFVASFRRFYHHRPSTHSYYGYEAAEMIMRALADVAPSDDDRHSVLFGLVREFIPDQLGPSFTFTNGSVESIRYGVDNFTAAGTLQPYRTVTALHLLTSAG